MAEPIRVRLTKDAEADLQAIADYLAGIRGLDEAEALLDSVTSHIETLSRFPLRGPAPKELRNTGERNVRQTQFKHCRIFYDVTEASVTVFLIADGRRDIDTLLSTRLLNRSAD